MAEASLILHFLVVVFLVAGFPVGLYYNHAGFRCAHAAVLGGITLLILLGYPCPLTVLEEAWGSRSHGGSWLASWLNRILYLEWFDPNTVFWMDVAFAALVVSSFAWRPVRKKR